MSDRALFKLAMQEYLGKQRLALIIAFDDPLKYPIAVKDAYDSVRSSGPGVGTATLEWNQYGKDFIRQIQGQLPEYWVSVMMGRSAVRRGFIKFLGKVMGAVPVHGQLRDAGLNVDHMYAESVAHKEGLKFVRTALISSIVNQNTGWAIEKGLKRESLSSPWRRHIDVIAILKGMNIRPPLNLHDYEIRRNDIASALSRAGIRDTQESILMMMDGFLQYYPVLGNKKAKQ